jgi:hypothetical protein
MTVAEAMFLVGWGKRMVGMVGSACNRARPLILEEFSPITEDRAFIVQYQCNIDMFMDDLLIYLDVLFLMIAISL